MLFTAYVIVRTVPSANRPNRREKKKVCDTEPTEGERLVRQLWHYTPFTVEKTSKTGPACSV